MNDSDPTESESGTQTPPPLTLTIAQLLVISAKSFVAGQKGEKPYDLNEDEIKKLRLSLDTGATSESHSCHKCEEIVLPALIGKFTTTLEDSQFHFCSRRCMFVFFADYPKDPVHPSTTVKRQNRSDSGENESGRLKKKPKSSDEPQK